MTIAMIGGFITVGGVAATLRASTTLYQSQVALGLNTYVITPSSSRGFPASQCDAIQNIDGVLSAGARISVHTVTPTSVPNTPIAVWEVTPGLVRFAFPDLRATPLSGTAFGSAVAADVGARPGSIYKLVGARDRYMAVWGVSSIGVERLSGSTRAALVPVVTDLPVNACFVETKPTHRDSVGEALVTWFGPASNWTVAPLLPAGQFEVDIEDSVRNGPMTWAGIALGSVTVLTATALSWSRRQEFALYALVGFGPSQVLGLFTLEWCYTVLAPAVCGGLLAASYDGLTGIDPSFWPVAGALVIAHYLVVCAGPPISFAVIRATPPIDLLKGA